ncbi:MAG: tetratricopeptide repeat protein [Bacteroidia bacterium]|nr:tetratricopeptide repeat protein [Bacteroidia bacterium]
MKKHLFIFFILLSSFLFAQKKDKAWFLLDGIDYKTLSPQDKYIFDSILPLYHTANHDSIRLRHLIFFANTLGDEKIWPRYNQLALKLAEKGGEDRAFLIFKTHALNNVAYELSTLKNDAKGALAIYEDIYKIQNRLNDLTGLSATTNNLANIYKKQGNTEKAIEYHLKSLATKEKNNDKLGVGISYNNLGSIYRDQGDLVSAVNCFSKALKLFESQKDNRQVANALINLGRVYQNQGDVNKALENYKKAKLLFEMIGERQSVASTLHFIGLAYEDKGESEKVFKNYYEAKREYEKIGDLIGIGNSHIYMAEAYKRLGRQDSAIILLNKACDIFKEGENKYSLTQAYSNLADIYFERDELLKAENYAKEALQIAETFGYPSLIRGPSYVLYRVYKKQSKIGPSLEMYEQFIKMRDSLDRIENKKGILKQQFKSEYDKKIVADSIAQANERLIEQSRHEHEIARQRLFTYGGGFGFVLMLVIAFISFRAFKNKQHANKEISQQKHIIEEKQKAIVDSINYAKRIQYTLLAHEDLLKGNLNEHFVIFKPKDIVSGDFYWATSANNKFYLAVCDSTGHGVPGAFMSLLNIGFLSEAINEKGIYQPHEVLNYVRQKLIESISKEEQKDGFDGTLVCFDKANNTITYSSANNRVLLFQNEKINELGYDKMPVGQAEKLNSFNSHTVNSNKGDILYLLTDGYSDQFGGPAGKKFKYKQFSETLHQIATLPLPQQKEKLEFAFNAWKGEQEQVDDVCVIGIRL